LYLSDVSKFNTPTAAVTCDVSENNNTVGSVYNQFNVERLESTHHYSNMSHSFNNDAEYVEHLFTYLWNGPIDGKRNLEVEVIQPPFEFQDSYKHEEAANSGIADKSSWDAIAYNNSWNTRWNTTWDTIADNSRYDCTDNEQLNRECSSYSKASHHFHDVADYIGHLFAYLWRIPNDESFESIEDGRDCHIGDAAGESVIDETLEMMSRDTMVVMCVDCKRCGYGQFTTGVDRYEETSTAFYSSCKMSPRGCEDSYGEMSTAF